MSTSPKSPYEVVDAFWHDGVLRRPGDTLNLSEPEAKYQLLGGHIKPKAAPAAASAVAAPVAPALAAPAPADAVPVAEAASGSKKAKG